MRSTIRKIRSLIALSSVALTIAACGGADDDLPRLAVSGTVTLDGQPLDHGTIEFVPLAQQATDVGGFVTDGKFAIPKAGGPVEGAYKIIINSGPPTGEAAGPAVPFGKKAAKPQPSRIPEKYNLKSTLTCEVKAGGPTTFDFAMTSK